MNIPLALITIAFTLIGVAPDAPVSRRDHPGWSRRSTSRASRCSPAPITSLLLFLSDLRAPAWWLLPVTVILGAGAGVVGATGGRPADRRRMLAKNRPLQRTYLRQTLAPLASYAALYGTSQWMEAERRTDTASPSG